MPPCQCEKGASFGEQCRGPRNDSPWASAAVAAGAVSLEDTIHRPRAGTLRAAADLGKQNTSGRGGPEAVTHDLLTRAARQRAVQASASYERPRPASRFAMPADGRRDGILSGEFQSLSRRRCHTKRRACTAQTQPFRKKARVPHLRVKLNGRPRPASPSQLHGAQLTNDAAGHA